MLLWNLEFIEISSSNNNDFNKKFVKKTWDIKPREITGSKNLGTAASEPTKLFLANEESKGDSNDQSNSLNNLSGTHIFKH